MASKMTEPSERRTDPAFRDRIHIAASQPFITPVAAQVPADFADATRADMLHAVDGQLAELNQRIGAPHAAGVDGMQAATLTEAASTLTALRGQIETARSPIQLASLRVVMTAAMQNASVAAASSAGISAQQQSAARLYDAQMGAAERGMAEIARRDEALFASADNRASALGLDVGFFRDQRALLETEAEAARKRGDRYGAIVPEGLLAHNTANLWEDVAARSGSPEDRKKAEESRKLVQEADRRVREAAQAEATRAAAGRPFATAADRDRWIAADANQRFEHYQERVETLQQSDPKETERGQLSSLSHAAFAEAASGGTAINAPERESSLATSLPLSVRNAAREAVRPIAPSTASAEADDEHPAAPVTPARKPPVKSSPGGSVTF